MPGSGNGTDHFQQAEQGETMKEILVFAGVAVAYVLLVRVVLPKFGIEMG